MPKLGLIHVDTPSDVPGVARLPMANIMPPTSVDWLSRCPADGDMLGNDVLGDCVQVAKLRTIQIRRAIAMGDSWKPTLDMAVGLYQRETGYSPDVPGSDQGTMTDTSMRAWTASGVRVNDQDLDVVHWLSVPRRSALQTKLALAHTGPLQLSLNLPAALQDIVQAGKDWELPASFAGGEWTPGSWGAHRVVLGGYDPTGWKIRTWGMDVRMDFGFMIMFGLAIDATLSREWFTAVGTSPAGMTWDEATAELPTLGVLQA